MSWLSFFIPRTILRFSTKFNHDIRVNEEYGNYKLLVSGSRQSGAYIESLWKKVLKYFGLSRSNDRLSILVLGVAGGNVIKLLYDMYPNSTITGVDIDPAMVDIGYIYFGLSKIPTFNCLITDAQDFIEQQAKRQNRYDLIIVDLFSGRIIPEFVQSKAFLYTVKRVLNKHGYVVINYLREKEYWEKSNVLLDKLTEIFHSVKDIEIFNNRFFMTSE